MKELQPPDSFHLRAAEGWLELGNHAEANAELEKIAAAHRAHPAVLRLRWNVYAMAKQWEVCVETARTWTTLAPDQEGGWINLGNSLYFCGRTQEAYDTVKPVLERFPKSAVLRYNIACYSCQLGDLQQAKSWLEQAFDADPTQILRRTALEDPDLEPLWRELKG